jgi:hypothetical protein
MTRITEVDDLQAVYLHHHFLEPSKMSEENTLPEC